MQDMKSFARDLEQIASAVQRLQKRLGALSKGPSPGPARATQSSGLLLMRRHQVLSALGVHHKVSRAAWSHDRGDAVVFDAWEDGWRRDDAGNFERYPMRTNDDYNLERSRTDPERGHTRWQHHVDMVLAGQRAALAIVPVRSKAASTNQRTRGWLPQYVTGKIVRERDGQCWFRTENVVPL